MVVSVEQIFLLQERCLQHAKLSVIDQFNFSKDCIELIINRKLHPAILENLDSKDKERICGIHTYLNDAVSHLLISLKLALYGAHVESRSILRNALERMANMAAMVEYKKLTFPLNRHTSFQKIQAKKEIKKLYTYLSRKIVHAETSVYQYFDLDGKSYPRLGLAIDPAGTGLVMQEIAKSCLYIVRVLTSFYSLKPETVGEVYFQQVRSLEEKFTRLG